MKSYVDSRICQSNIITLQKDIFVCRVSVMVLILSSQNVTDDVALKILLADGKKSDTHRFTRCSAFAVREKELKTTPYGPVWGV